MIGRLIDILQIPENRYKQFADRAGLHYNRFMQLTRNKKPTVDEREKIALAVYKIFNRDKYKKALKILNVKDVVWGKK